VIESPRNRRGRLKIYLSYAAGAATASITIPILPNGILNGARTFTVSLDSPTGANIGTISTITVTLNDDERGVRFDSATYFITEGESTAIKVKRMGPTTAAMTATWATVNGSAVSGTDFGTAGVVAPRTGSLSWGIGDATDKTIIIPSIQNGIDGQPNRSFNVVLTPGGGISLGAPGTTTVTIQDDDILAESQVRFDVTKLVVVENVGTAVLTLHRELTGATPSFARDVTVKYATVAGTALATSDYLAVTNGTVHWGPGDSADKPINITIVNNTIAEPTESFKVVLSAPTPGFKIADTPPEATITILDDDEAFPLDGVIPAGFSQAAGTTKSWHVSNDPGAYEGAFTLKSDEIDDGETAGIEMNGTFTAGTVAFKVKVSSEAGFDKLQFYIDGLLKQEWSGTAVAGWQSASFPITPTAVHSLKWVYVKDGSVSVGMDAVYIDGLTTSGFTP